MSSGNQVNSNHGIRDKIVDNSISILATILTAGIAIFINMRMNLAVMESRLTNSEIRIENVERSVKDMSTTLSQVRADVSYIRGVIEMSHK